MSSPVMEVSAPFAKRRNDLGADDYATKPFNTEELLARIRVALRQRVETGAERQLVEVGGVSIDPLKRESAGTGPRFT